MLISNIKKLRTAKEIYTLGKFAELCGVTRNTAFLWERGKSMPSVSNMSKICDVLGCEYGDLYTNTTAAPATPAPSATEVTA